MAIAEGICAMILAEYVNEGDLAALELRYTADPVPPCRVCGKPLAAQSVGGGKPTVYACSEPGDTSKWNGPGAKHYQDSRWTQYHSGDSEVLRLIHAYRAALMAINPT